MYIFLNYDFWFEFNLQDKQPESVMVSIKKKSVFDSAILATILISLQMDISLTTEEI